MNNPVDIIRSRALQNTLYYKLINKCQFGPFKQYIDGDIPGFNGLGAALNLSLAAFVVGDFKESDTQICRQTQCRARTDNDSRAQAQSLYH